MVARGQQSFVCLPSFAARLTRASRTRAIEQQHSDIAHDLVSKVGHGRLLDVGTSPGRLLLEAHKLRPDIELFGFGG
jgi:hypothetical protein